MNSDRIVEAIDRLTEQVKRQADAADAQLENAKLARVFAERMAKMAEESQGRLIAELDEM